MTGGGGDAPPRDKDDSDEGKSIKFWHWLVLLLIYLGWRAARSDQ